MRRIGLLGVGLVLLAGIAVATSGGATQTPPRWVATDLGTLGGEESEALAINEAGQVVGSADTRLEDADGFPVPRAFLWERGKLRSLGTLPRLGHCQGVDINERGEIVGRCESGSFASRAVLWRGEQPLDLGVLKRPGYRFANSDARLISNHGQIVGSSWEGLDGDDSAAFLWTQGKMLDLGSLGLDPVTTEATAINERGQVVGGAWADSDLWHAFHWQAGVMRDLGASGTSSEALTLNERGQIAGWSGRGAALWQSGALRELRPLPARRYAEAHAINERALVVGWSSATVTTDGDARSPRATLWRAGRALDLGVLQGTRFSKAVAINDRGLVVGWSAKRLEFGDPRDPRASVWQDGRITPLPTLGGRLSQPVAINNHGQIIGWAETSSGHYHAVLWTLRRG